MSALPDAAPDGRPPAGTLRAGVWLLVLSAVAFSTAGLFTHEAGVAVWATIFWRNLFGAIVLVAVLLVEARVASSRPQAVARPHWGLRECGVVATASLGTILYIAALETTSVANVSIVYATSPMIAALTAWLVRRERASRRTLASAGLALVGVAVTMGGSLNGGHLGGDLLALAMTLTLSVMAVLMRGSTLSASMASLASAVLTAVVVLPLGWADGSGFALDARSALWLAGFGAVAMGIAMPSYLAGAARVPSGRAMLITALDMPLAPLWVWLVLGEVPAVASAIGGAIVLVAVLGDLPPAAKHGGSVGS